jgi:hypothetical protein
MPRRPYDPLEFVPSPDVVRAKLTETLTLADRLRILLDLSERLHLPTPSAGTLATPEPERQAVARAC